MVFATEVVPLTERCGWLVQALALGLGSRGGLYAPLSVQSQDPLIRETWRVKGEQKEEATQESWMLLTVGHWAGLLLNV